MGRGKDRSQARHRWVFEVLDPGLSSVGLSRLRKEFENVLTALVASAAVAAMAAALTEVVVADVPRAAAANFGGSLFANVAVESRVRDSGGRGLALGLRLRNGCCQFGVFDRFHLSPGRP